MAIYQSGWATRQRNTPNAGCAGVVVAQVFEYTLTDDVLAQGDIIELGVLPAGNTVVGAKLICDQLDTGGNIVFDVGIMSGQVGEDDPARTCGDEIFSGADVGQAGGVVDADAETAFLINAVGVDRSVGVVITTAAASQATAGAKLRLLLQYVAV
jgi:hypothetical protein